jgi:hypothetical protein
MVVVGVTGLAVLVRVTVVSVAKAGVIVVVVTEVLVEVVTRELDQSGGLLTNLDLLPTCKDLNRVRNSAGDTGVQDCGDMV